MTRTRAFVTTAVFFLLSVSSGLLATEWHVAPPPLGNDSNPGTNELPFATIQHCIDVASSGDTVTVAQGTYVENIKFNGKNIVLTSTDPLDPAVVAGTIIDGNKAGSVVTFFGTETEACVLSGFTIRNGETSGCGGGILGGTCPPGTHATIENNTITANSAKWGGGLGGCNGTVQNNTITGNSAGQFGGGLCGCNGTVQNNTITGNSAVMDGGGLCSCLGTIQNNTITGNEAGDEGGGLASCHGTIQNNTITDNSATGDWAAGGGLYYCEGTIQNNAITGNSAQEFEGGGLASCHGTIQNNTIADNVAEYGGGLAACDGTIQNNTITANSAAVDGGGVCSCLGTIQNNTITGNSAVMDGGGVCSCLGTIQNNTITGNSAGQDGGGVAWCEGTVPNFPNCVIRNCIIWGNTAPSGPELYESAIPSFSCIEGWSGGGQGNTASEPRFVDANAHDYHLQGGSPCIDAGANHYWFAWPERDLDGNCRVAGLAVDMGCYEYGSSPDADGDLLSDSDESGAGTDPLRDDSDGDGLRDGLEFLRGSNPLQVTPPGILNVPLDIPTIQQSLCVSMAGDEIIVAPGSYRENLQFGGPDIILRSSDPGDPDVVGSTVIDGGGTGPVVSFTGGEGEACLLAGLTIRNGSARGGGGIKGSGTRATIHNSTITGNWAYLHGGGLCACDGTIQNNTISDNSASYGGGLAFCGGTIQNNTITANSAGGGLDSCNGTIQNNTISDNSANYGGGLAWCDGTIQNNTISGNSAWYGGGLIWCHDTIRNNTVTGNSAEYGGGGLSGCNGTIQNCIMWGNTAPTGAQLYESSDPTYSCIEGWSGDPATGNISGDPCFAGPHSGDFRLLPSSPCIDAGYNDPALPPTDIAGMHRVMYGGKSLTVDMGAYEFYVNTLSRELGGNAVLTWSSLAGKTYSVLTSSDMLTWETAADNVPSSGGTTTTWSDTTAAFLSPAVRIRYYRAVER